MKRILALDVGTVRIGVAVSDPLGSFAQGIAVFAADRDWLAELDKTVAAYGVQVIVLGLPVRTTGEEGPEAKRIHTLAKKLRRRYPDLEITTWDERFTTVTASQVLLEADVSREKRKGHVDKIAATVLLQGYLDRLRERGGAP
ncbi:Holliday junction resolvase RuvX [Aminiphilus sp.]|jgi:putative Holliday junction resolvase|uniref:Holliday junction resolvase RuvX n=1 Tax=Aminiphilus sp. TaxID=1872488 RepID=UPI00262A50D2|nr:Holliday junction resolvase RuvX [Aminiphilus sp.]